MSEVETIICMADNRPIDLLDSQNLLHKIFCINYSYARKNKYRFMFFQIEKLLDINRQKRHGAWGKVAILEHLSRAYPNSKIVYIDSDAIFASQDKPVDLIFTTDKTIVMWEDALGKKKRPAMLPISGVIGVKNIVNDNKHIAVFLSEWYGSKETHHWEQGVLQKTLFPKYKQHIHILPSLGFDFHKDSAIHKGFPNDGYFFKQCRFKETNEGQSYYHHNIQESPYIFHFLAELKNQKSAEVIITEIFDKYDVSSPIRSSKLSKTISTFEGRACGTLHEFI